MRKLGDVTGVRAHRRNGLGQVADGTPKLRPRRLIGRAAADALRDADLEAELPWPTTKENAEHVMLVDLAPDNDLGRVATAGSVRVDPYRSSSATATSCHLVSGVNGQLREGPG